MPQPKFDWFKAFLILALGVGIIYALILLSKSDLAVFFPSAG